MRSLNAALLVGGTLLAQACANDPTYMECPDTPTDPLCVRTVEAGQDDGMGGTIAEVKTHLVIPIKIEKAKDAAARAARSAELGVEVPYVKLGDIEVEVEWTITNLDAMDSQAKVELDGANEYFTYDPDLIVLSNDREAPPTPGLDGNIPIHVPANGSVTGIFREDQLREASIDLEQVTRANVNPFAATLRINKNDSEIVPFLPFDPTMPDLPPMPDPNAVPIPREAFANIIRIDLVFQPSAHMTLTYDVRVRDVRGGMINDELFTAPVDEVTQFAPMDFAAMAAPGT
jgi:hypothetical protein